MHCSVVGHLPYSEWHVGIKIAIHSTMIVYECNLITHNMGGGIPDRSLINSSKIGLAEWQTPSRRCAWNPLFFTVYQIDQAVLHELIEGRFIKGEQYSLYIIHNKAYTVKHVIITCVGGGRKLPVVRLSCYIDPMCRIITQYQLHL